MLWNLLRDSLHQSEFHIRTPQPTLPRPDGTLHGRRPQGNGGNLCYCRDEGGGPTLSSFPPRAPRHGLRG